jgi:NADPH:quinone reductase
MMKRKGHLMRAIAPISPCTAEELIVTEQPLPVCGPHEVLIRVIAAGVNRPDVLQRKGLYAVPQGASKVLGLEVAGIIESVGPKATRWKKGDAVMALLSGGGYADYAVAHEDLCLSIPPGLSFEQAAGIPEAFFTVWHNVFERGALKKGETLLIHGGASGIGTTAIMLAKAFGADVITTVGTSRKAEACLALGARAAILYGSEDFVAITKDITQGHGADVILDMVGGQTTSLNMEAASIEGRIVQIAFLESRKAQIDLSLLMQKRLTLTGSTLRGRSVEVKAKLAKALSENVAPLWGKGECLPVIDHVFALEEANKAHARMEKSEHIGKIVLKINAL